MGFYVFDAVHKNLYIQIINERKKNGEARAANSKKINWNYIKNPDGEPPAFGLDETNTIE